ncbi:MAG: type IV secretion system protein [Rickettsiales bacterium]|nr:type IV secretion system protein [Rickettsiales bacterium]
MQEKTNNKNKYNAAQPHSLSLRSIKSRLIAMYSLVALALVILVTLALPAEVWAATPPPPSRPPGTCTFDPQFDVPYAVITPGSGMISRIVLDIRSVLTATVYPMYRNLLESSSFSTAVSVAMTIYIAVYGVLFTFGMVQVTVYDFFMRMLKFGVVAGFVIINPSWWLSVYDTLILFFVDGTDAIIAQATVIMVGGVSAPYDQAAPFKALDGLIATAISAKMAVTILATFFTGPYGLMFGILILLSLGAMLKALFSAIWVYLMGLVLKMLLIALAPLFIAFLLFDRTRHLFDGWLNQLVNACLQPIFVFLFFAFFVALLQASINNILKTPVCWTEWMDSVRGTPFAVHYWRFAVRNSSGNWEPYSGNYDFTGIPGNATAPIFPIDIMSIIIFLILAELAGRFNNVVTMIANEIASASTKLSDFQGPLSDWMSGGSGGGGSGSPAAAGGVGSRPTPGGSTGAPSAGSFDKARNELAKKGMMDTVKEAMQNMPTNRGGPGRR